MDRLAGISQGAKDATAYDFFKKMGDKVRGWMPEKKDGVQEVDEGPADDPNDLGNKIAGVSRMVQNPESTSTEWESSNDKFLETGNLDDISDTDLMDLFEQIRGYNGEDRQTMIEELNTYRDRMASR